MNDKLWKHFVEGEPKAFETIYQLHIDEMMAYGLKLHPNKDIIKDCVQDVFINLFENKKQLSVPTNLNFYLFKILKRTLFRKLKREKRFDKFNERKTAQFQTVYSIEKKLIEEEEDSHKTKLIVKCLKSLTSKQQELLYLRFHMNFSYREISKIIDIDHNSVRKQVYRTIKKIRSSDAFNKGVDLILFLQFIQKN